MSNKYRKQIGVLLAGLIALLGVTAAQADGQAPLFDLPGNNGQVSLKSLNGQVVYVDFWASWCTPCRKSFPWMNQIQETYGNKGLSIVAINLDKDKDAVGQFLRANPAKFTVAYDPAGDTASAYKVQGMPSSYLIDRQGRIRHSHIGFREISKADLEGRIRQLLAEK